MTDKGIFTAIDACINRAREGLRVCEDILRFVNHSPLSVKFKKLRHRLTAACAAFPSDALLEGRDVPSDSQRFADTEAEMTRKDTDAVFSANIHRAMEAVRTLEELAKLFPGAAPASFQEIRFDLYHLEKRFAVERHRVDGDFFRRGILYAVLDPLLISDGEYVETGRRMIEGGASVIQLNTWGEKPALMLEAAKGLARLCDDGPAIFIVGGSLEIAVLSGAHGLFLDDGDICSLDARSLFPGGIIGVSVHAREQMDSRWVHDADFIAAGPIYNTTDRNGEFLNGAGPGFLAGIVSLSSVPVIAYGGIMPEHIAELSSAGCDSFLMRASLYAEGCIEDNCRTYVRAIAGRFEKR